MPDPSDRDRLTGLVQFASELLRARDKTVMALREYGLGVFHETDLFQLPGITRNDPGSWLRVPRLRRIAGPSYPDKFEGWVEGETDTPNHPPELMKDRSLLVSIEEASELSEAGFIEEGDVAPYYPLDEVGGSDETPKSDNLVHVVLRTSKMSEWRAAFAEWREQVWQPWANEEGPRRNTISVYEVLYRLHSLMQAGNDREMPEVIFGIGVARWNVGSAIIDMPLIEKPCELILENDGTLAVVPRFLPPTINLKPFRAVNLDSADRAQEYLSKQLEARAADIDLPLDPHDSSSFDDILIEAVTRLSSKATFVPASNLNLETKLPPAGADLVVYGSWVVFARPRSLDWRQQDLQRIQSEIRDCSEGELQKPLVGLVKPPSNEQPTDGFDGNWDFTRTEFGRGISGTNTGSHRAGATEAEENRRSDNLLSHTRYFFPLPFNEEQARIVETLEEQDIAVVTGPPGTGKTHTIANVIAHYMANGRRVLVTARTAEAIAAVQDKLPPELRPMTIAVVHSDRQGAKQLEAAVQALADEAASANTDDLKIRIKELHYEIDSISDEITDIDAKLGQIARVNLETIHYRGKDHLPMELAEILGLQKARYEWFDDRPRPETLQLELPELLTKIVEIREALLEDTVYLDARLPKAEDLPSTNDLIAAMQHEEHRRARVSEDFSRAPVMALDSEKDEVEARELNERIIRCSSCFLSASDISREIYIAIASERLARSAVTVGPILNRIGDLINTRDEISSFPISLPETHWKDEGFIVALTRLSRGERPFGLAASLFARDLKAALAAVRFGDREPQSADEWNRIALYRKWLIDRGEVLELWRQNPHLPPLDSDIEAFPTSVRPIFDEVSTMLAALEELIAVRYKLERLFPYGLDDIDGILNSGDLEPILFAFRGNLEEDADRRHPALESLFKLADQGRGPLFRSLGELAGTLEAGSCDPREVIEARAALTKEIARLAQRRQNLDRLSELLAFLAKLGAPQWAQRLRDPMAETSKLVPADWLDAWEWAIAQAQIDAVVGLEKPAILTSRKAELVKRKSQRFERLIRERTLLGLKGHLTEKIRHALHLFTTAVRNLGAGTGQNASRWLRQIREAALDAAPAAPVWIMPEHRIAEQLPPQLASFDLVVLDEASQSDVTAIGALARGKKWLIVGDEQQVSPTAVGIPQSQVDGLRAQWLRHLSFRNAIDQDTSIFDLASMMYPRAHLMLREHFRSVAPIIQFSTRYYNGRLIPLRVPKASERLDPPLIDIFVADGEYVSKWNRQERDVIVEEVAKIVNDSEMRHRTIAVISLVGSTQADNIERALLSDPRIGHEAIERHRIVCGDSRTMQGQERDIVFLSMVQAGRSTRALTTRGSAQRFNVAMSRARDRLYLVRSLAASQLRAEDLKRQVIDHFANPMPEGHKIVCSSILDRCDSGFERVVCKRLLDAGYRVRPQVKAGPYSIDLVVEGREDRRLAIELDGDKYHGPDRWDEDMRRQAALERAGWIFWRVFGSQWNTETEFWWQDLVSTLERLGIEPIGAEATNEVFTEHRRVENGHVLDVAEGTIDVLGETEGDGSAADITTVVPSAEPEETRERVAPSAPNGQGELPMFLRRQPITPLLDSLEPQALQSPAVSAGEFYLPHDNLHVEENTVVEREKHLGESSDDIQAIANHDEIFPHSLYHDNQVVAAGMTVRVRYLGEDRSRTFSISLNRNAPNEGIIHIAQPLAQALIGAGIDEEVDYWVNGEEKSVLIEAIFDNNAVAAE